MRVDAPVLAAYIEANPGVMPASVAEHLDVSVRTVRTYVNQTNSAMEGFARIELSRKNGYHLEIQDMARYEAWTADAREKKQTLPQTPQARVSYLLNDLLMRTDWITLDDLREVLFVSRSTISNDLKRVQSVLESFGLALEMRPHYGIRVSGSEMARRLCLANIIMDAFNGAAETESDPGIAISTLLSDYGRRSEVGIHNPTLDTISNCVESVAVAENFQINAVAYQNLLIHIAVALVRIQEDCYVPMETERLERMKGQREYQVAEKIADAIDREMNVQLPEEEIAYIAIHLAGKRTMLGAGASEDEGLVISDGVWRVVSEMLDCVWNAFRFDFRNDLELRMNLARHIVPLAVRLRYHMNLKNPLLADIKTRYALAYSMAIDASTVLTRAYDADLSEDEMGYIALAFALALERQKTEAPKKNILVVCASGAGSARLLEYRCRREFADYVDKVMTCDVLGLETFDFSKVDYVFTTVPIHRKLPVPVREVTYFLGDEDVVEMRELLGARGHGPVPSYFKPSLFFPHMTQTSKQDALDFLLDQVCASEPVARNFRELVWKREAMISTSFGNNVAIPHPLEAASSETFICVGLLDHPVAWDTNGQEVQAVFLLGFAAEQDGSLHQFMDTFASVLMDRDAIELLVKRQSWETLAEILAKAQGRQDEAAESDGSSASGA